MLTNEDIKLLIDSCSFSLNSIHYKNKFHKYDFIISPNDIIYLINKIFTSHNIKISDN